MNDPEAPIIGNDMNRNGSLLFGDKINELKEGKGVKE